MWSIWTSDNTHLRTLNSVKELPLYNHLLVCQIEWHSNLVEKREESILRSESTPMRKNNNANRKLCKRSGILFESLFYLATAYTPSTNSHSPKALYRWTQDIQKFEKKNGLSLEFYLIVPFAIWTYVQWYGPSFSNSSTLSVHDLMPLNMQPATK